MHYLDSAATAQMPEAVIAALQKFGRSLRANVYGGVYKLAQEALAEYEAARADVARFLGAASPQEIVFTYGTTSSLNLLSHSFGERLREGDEIVLSILEHHSNTLPWRALARAPEGKHPRAADDAGRKARSLHSCQNSSLRDAGSLR